MSRISIREVYAMDVTDGWVYVKDGPVWPVALCERVRGESKEKG